MANGSIASSCASKREHTRTASSISFAFGMVMKPTGASTLVRSPWCCASRSEEHTSELQSPCNLVCRLLLEKNKGDEFTHLFGLLGRRRRRHEVLEPPARPRNGGRGRPRGRPGPLRGEPSGRRFFFDGEGHPPDPQFYPARPSPD